jgi:Sulfotransferase domain.
MFLTNYLQRSTTPIRLSGIHSDDNANITSSFEDLMGLDTLDLTPNELDLYLPTYYSIVSSQKPTIVYKKVHNAYYINSAGSPIFPTEISKCALYFIRNPLDVAVSYSNHTSLPIDEIVQLLLNEDCRIGGKYSIHLLQRLYSWVGHVESWCNQKSIKTHVVRYEDMLTAPLETFSGIVDFLGFEKDQERVKTSIHNCEFKVLREMEDKDGFGERTSKCKNFFWKGTSGNYKNHLTAKQIEQIVEYCFEPMKRFGYLDSNGNLTV